ncbi:tumor necrosis factor ligand superfamily member 15-like [Haliotis asinina]|uniref:tumor necrosis factor ligand superfamily member 15-like n=1 Tax=Haliotis asinina TaxID=109174 RepID=UPI003531D732
MEVRPQTHYEEVRFVETKKPRKSRVLCSTFLCFAVLTLSMVLNVGLGAFVIYKIRHEESLATFASYEEMRPDIADAVCVSCDSVNVPDGKRAPFEDQVKVGRLGQRSLCCLEHTESLAMFMNIVVGEHYQYVQGDLHINKVRPAAHVYLDTNNVTDQRLQWDSSVGHGTAYMTGNVTYSNGRLHVPRDGMYYIYSFLTIRSDAAATNDNHDIMHRVQTYNYDQMDTANHLLLTRKTTLKDKHRQFTKSFVAANLKLKKNDELFVSLSNPSLIYKFPLANYFGIYLL